MKVSLPDFQQILNTQTKTHPHTYLNICSSIHKWSIIDLFIERLLRPWYRVPISQVQGQSVIKSGAQTTRTARITLVWSLFRSAFVLPSFLPGMSLFHRKVCRFLMPFMPLIIVCFVWCYPRHYSLLQVSFHSPTF